MRTPSLLIPLFALALGSCVMAQVLAEDTLGAKCDFVRWQSIIDGNQATEKCQRQWTIVNARGDRFNRFSFYRQPTSQLKKLQITVFDHNGDVAYKRKSKDMGRLRGFDQGALYSDIIQYHTDCPGPSYPYTILVEHEVKHRSLFYLRGASVQRSIPVAEFEYELIVKGDVPITFRADSGVQGSDVLTEGDRRFYKWWAESIPAFDAELQIPVHSQPWSIDIVPGRFKLEDYSYEGSEWDDIAAWYRALANDRYSLSSSVGADTSSPSLETARCIYEEVVDGTRYVLVSIEISGWQPAAAEETKEVGYGDCKGLSTLLISKLRGHGIEAYPALILTRNRGAIDPSFPCFQFNHLISVAIIDEDTIWMDPTCSTCPFGELPNMDEDQWALIVTEDKGELVRTTASAPEQNRLVACSEIKVEKDGHLAVRSDLTALGNNAVMLSYLLEHTDAEHCDDLIDGMLPLEFDLVSWRTLEDVTDCNHVKLLVYARSKAPATKIGNAWYVIPTAIASSMPRSCQNRIDAIDLDYPMELVDSITVLLDDAVGPLEPELPSDSAVKWSLGATSCVYELTSSRAVAAFTRTHSAYLATGREAQNYEVYCSEERNLRRRPIVLSFPDSSPTRH